MLCQNCKQNEASISYMQVINGAVTKVSLCENCAREKKIKPIDINIPFSVKDLFASLMDMDKSSTYEAEKEKACPKMSLYLQQISSSWQSGL